MSNTSNMNKINCRNLLSKQYSMEELAANIDALQIKIILHNQVLTADFCGKYILDEYHATCQEDLYLIDVGYVLQHQPHLTREEVVAAYLLHEPTHIGEKI